MAKRGIGVWTMRVGLFLLALVVLAALAIWLLLRGSLATLDGDIKAPGLTATVTVARDARGVPVISGADRTDLAYATGYVHAQERFFQMDLLRRVGAGELAELFGPKALPVDRAHRLHRFRAQAERTLQAMSADERRMLDRYVAGVNDGLNALAARPFEYALIGQAPRPWNAADSLLVVCAMYFDLQDNLAPRELARGWLLEHASAEQRAFLLPESSEWDAPLDADRIDASPVPIPASAPAWWGRSRKGPSTVLASRDFTDAVGSNNWAVAGSRSSTGAAIVSDDMHLNLRLPNIWYRVALQFPDAAGKPRRTVGVTLPGALPVVIVGSNGHLAWGFTNSYGDYLDLIKVGSDPAKPGQVRTPGGWETPATHSETILVKGAPSATMAVRETAFGPLTEIAGKTYAVHWLAHRPEALNSNPRKLETADSVEEALKIAPTLGIPAQNFVGGDDKGNIGWTVAGMLPRRTQHGQASTYPLEADGATFDGILTAEEHPRLLNPPGGQLSSANSRQLNGAEAQLIGDGGFDIGARNHQVRDGLRALGAKADIAGVYRVALDDRALFIAPWRERALKVLDADALEGKPQRAELQRLLKENWDGHASVGSAAYRISRNFMWTMHDMLYGGAAADLAALGDKVTMVLASSRWPMVVARLVDEQNPAWLPPGYADWRAVQLAALDQVAAELTRDGTRLADASWGARNTIAIAHPIAQAVPVLKRWLSMPAERVPGDANMPRVAGPAFGQSERMTVSPGQEEQGVFNMPGGQSGHPLSPYFGDGQADYVKGTPSPLLPGPARHTLRFVR